MQLVPDKKYPGLHELQLVGEFEPRNIKREKENIISMNNRNHNNSYLIKKYLQLVYWKHKYSRKLIMNMSYHNIVYH